MTDSMPRPSDAAKTAFLSLLPPDPEVTSRPMFGNLAAFVNGNMVTGLYGASLFVRLSDDAREAVVRLGGGDFEPMPGRPMKGYVVVPDGWLDDLDQARSWVADAVRLGRELPAKQPKARKRKG